MESTAYYTLQLRILDTSTDGTTELEVMAHSTQNGTPFHGRFPQWEPIFNSICGWMNSSAFHRKAIQRTLSAGLPAHLIDRQTGTKYPFSAADIAILNLQPHEAAATLVNAA